MGSDLLMLHTYLVPYRRYNLDGNFRLRDYALRWSCQTHVELITLNLKRCCDPLESKERRMDDGGGDTRGYRPRVPEDHVSVMKGRKVKADSGTIVSRQVP